MAKLHFYYAAMNAGKSTVLLQSSYNYRERGMHTLLYIPSIDDRFQQGEIHSRIGLKAQGIMFDDKMNLFESVQEHVADQNTPEVRCVLLDEAQFLTKKQVMQLTDIADKLKIPVLTYGLRSDYMGEPFEGSRYLMAWAEELTEIKAICHCGRKATMNIRIDSEGKKIESGAQVHIAGNDSYTATCRRHFKQGDAGQ